MSQFQFLIANRLKVAFDFNCFNQNKIGNSRSLLFLFLSTEEKQKQLQRFNPPGLKMRNIILEYYRNIILEIIIRNSGKIVKQSGNFVQNRHSKYKTGNS